QNHRDNPNPDEHRTPGNRPTPRTRAISLGNPVDHKGIAARREVMNRNPILPPVHGAHRDLIRLGGSAAPASVQVRAGIAGGDHDAPPSIAAIATRMASASKRKRVVI